MATRTHSEKIGGKWKATRSHALCDDCGNEHETAHAGRVTAPLPAGWSYREEPSQSGASVQMKYSCCRPSSQSSSDGSK